MISTPLYHETVTTSLANWSRLLILHIGEVVSPSKFRSSTASIPGKRGYIGPPNTTADGLFMPSDRSHDSSLITIYFSAIFQINNHLLKTSTFCVLVCHLPSAHMEHVYSLSNCMLVRARVSLPVFLSYTCPVVMMSAVWPSE